MSSTEPTELFAVGFTHDRINRRRSRRRNVLQSAHSKANPGSWHRRSAMVAIPFRRYSSTPNLISSVPNGKKKIAIWKFSRYP